MSPVSLGRRALTLRVDADLWKRLRAFHLREGKRSEALSYVWARCERVLGGHVVLMPAGAPFLALDADCYERHGSAQVCLRPDVLNGMLVEFARSDFNCLVNVHDHWFAEDADFSGVDDTDDLAFDRYLRERFEPMLKRRPELGPARDIFNLSIVLGRSGCTARMIDIRRSQPFTKARQIALLGDRWSSAAVTGQRSALAPAGDWLSRHAGFLDGATQMALQELHVAVVGCGGLGSILAESLARAGIGALTLIDGDRIEPSNLNRWQGGLPQDIGRSKANVLAERTRAMFPHCRVRAVARPLEHLRSLPALAAADIILAGLDNDEARYVLNHLALQHLQPYFDLGVAITTTPRVDFSGRYFAVIPGVTGCVECKTYDLIDREEVIRHFSHPAVTQARRAAGYVIDRPEMATPSAYSLNQRTAALGVQELMNFLSGWRPTATVIREQWATGALQRADRDNYPERPDPDCPMCSLRIGRGWSVPLPRRPVSGDLRASLALSARVNRPAAEVGGS